MNRNVEDVAYKFSPTAYAGMKDIVLAGLDELLRFSGTSAIPFSNWMAPDSFVYFCLVASRCKECERVFLSHKTLDEIKYSDERPSARAVVQAHELFNFDASLLTHTQVKETFEEIPHPLTPQQLKVFTEDEKKLDFAFISKINETEEGRNETIANGVLVSPIFSDSGDQIEIEIIVANEAVHEKLSLKAAQDQRTKGLKIVFNKERFATYVAVKDLLDKSMKENEVRRLYSDFFLI